MAILSLLEEST